MPLCLSVAMVPYYMSQNGVDPAFARKKALESVSVEMNFVTLALFIGLAYATLGGAARRIVATGWPVSRRVDGDMEHAMDTEDALARCA